jgi:hypothetical protein
MSIMGFVKIAIVQCSFVLPDNAHIQFGCTVALLY